MTHCGEGSITVAGKVVKKSQKVAVVALERTRFENAGVFEREIVLFFLYLFLKLWIVGSFLFIEFQVFPTKVTVSIFVNDLGRTSVVVVARGLRKCGQSTD